MLDDRDSDVSVEEEELQEAISEMASGSRLKEDPLEYYERPKLHAGLHLTPTACLHWR